VISATRAKRNGGFPPAVGSRLRPPLGCRQKNLGKIRGTHAGCNARGLRGAAGSFRRGTYPPHKTCGHARGANTRGLRVDECPRCRPPPARKKRVESCGHARGWIPAGFAQPTTRRLRPPLGLSGSPAPSRGCLPGPRQAGSTMPRPQQRGRGLLLRVWALSWALPRNRCHSRAKPPPAPDCKSAIVGSTPTGASQQKTLAMSRKSRASRGFFCFQPRSARSGQQPACRGPEGHAIGSLTLPAQKHRRAEHPAMPCPAWFANRDGCGCRVRPRPLGGPPLPPPHHPGEARTGGCNGQSVCDPVSSVY
jgi:hypothetical protein